MKCRVPWPSEEQAGDKPQQIGVVSEGGEYYKIVLFC